MTILSEDKPKFVRRLDGELSKLVNLEFPLVRNYNLNGFNFHEIIEPSKFAENAVYSALVNMSAGARVENEPNGYRTFPDFRVKFANNFEYFFEVKSYVSRYRGWGAANVSEYNSSILNGDLKYFKTFYIELDLKRGVDYIRINGINIGRIYNFTNGSSIAGSTPYYPAKSSGGNLHSLLKNTIADAAHRELILSKLTK